MKIRYLKGKIGRTKIVDVDGCGQGLEKGMRTDVVEVVDYED